MPGESPYLYGATSQKVKDGILHVTLSYPKKENPAEIVSSMILLFVGWLRSLGYEDSQISTLLSLAMEIEVEAIGEEERN